jgi:hypothetical protein
VSGGNILKITKYTNVYIERVNFASGVNGIIYSTSSGGVFVNSGTITGCQFTNLSANAIAMGNTQATNILGCVFEDGSDVKAHAIDTSADQHGLNIMGCWFGDNTSTAANQYWIRTRGVGINIIGNYLSGGAGHQNTTGVVLSAVSHGVRVTGNDFELTGTGCKGIDGGAFANTDCAFAPNYISAVPTPITGMGSIAGTLGISSGYGAMRYASATTTFTTATWAPVDLATSIYDQGSIGAGGAGTGNKITIPTGGAGLWLFYGQITWTANATGIRQAGISKNSTTVATRSRDEIGLTAGDSPQPNIMSIELAADGDVFRLLGYQNSGGNLATTGTTSDLTFFGGFKLT